MVCCTNNWKDTVKRQIELHPDFSIFEFILNSADVGVRKPNEKIYRIVEDILGEREKDIFLIDDLKENCKGAEKLGWQTFQFDCNKDYGKTDSLNILNILGLN